MPAPGGDGAALSGRLELVFGYGSLTTGAVAGAGGGVVATLRGHRRVWGVAMDNRVDLPGYKFYLDADGRRPDVVVAFLDVVADEDPAAAVLGVCRRVDPAALRVLDRRERNYERVDVTDAVHGVGDPRARIWVYRGREESRRRLREGRRAGRAVIDAAYLRAVRAGLGELKAAATGASLRSLDPDGLPVVELRRHDLAAGDGVGDAPLTIG